MMLLSSPFRHQSEKPYQFGKNSDWSNITRKIRDTIPVMLRERLTPPPKQTYSLNRKLSGAFLLATRLQASVNCHALWDKLAKAKYRR